MGFFQARLLDWVPISFSRGSSQPRDRTHVPALAGGFSTTEPLGTWLPIAFRNLYHFQLEGFGKRATCTETETCRAHIGSTHQNAKGVKVKVKSLGRVQLFATPWTVAHEAPPSMRFSGKNTGLGCHFLLQGIFPTKGLNPGLPHCRQTLYHLSHQGSPGLCKDPFIDTK